MKTTRLVLTLSAFFVLSLSANVLRAATTIVDDGSTFTPGADDVYNLQGYSSAYDGGRDFTNNYPVPGQTFTTGGASSSFDLNAITLQEQSAGLGYESASVTYALAVYSVSGSSLTYIGGGSFTFNGTGAPVGDYVTFNLATPVVLAADTQYAFTLSANGGYFGLDGGYPSNDTYSGGQAITVSYGDGSNPTSGGTITTPSQTPYDRNFDVALSAAPEPSTWAMMLGGVVLLFSLLRFRRRTL